MRANVICVMLLLQLIAAREGRVGVCHNGVSLEEAILRHKNRKKNPSKYANPLFVDFVIARGSGYNERGENCHFHGIISCTRAAHIKTSVTKLIVSGLRARRQKEK